MQKVREIEREIEKGGCRKKERETQNERDEVRAILKEDL